MKTTSWQVKDEVRVMSMEKSEREKCGKKLGEKIKKKKNVHFAVKLAIGFGIMLLSLFFL